jgi:hypothetical protein
VTTEAATAVLSTGAPSTARRSRTWTRPPAGSATTRPTRAPATTASARALRRRRHLARLRHHRGPYSQALTGLAPRRPTTTAPSPRTRSARASARCSRSPRPARRSSRPRRDRPHRHGATLNGSANPNLAEATGLVPLRHHRPGRVRRRLRHARPRHRRHARSAPAAPPSPSPRRSPISSPGPPTTSAPSPRTRPARLRRGAHLRHPGRRPDVTTSPPTQVTSTPRSSTARRTRTATRRPAGSATPPPTPASATTCSARAHPDTGGADLGGGVDSVTFIQQITGPPAGREVLLLRDRRERGRHRLRRGAVLHRRFGCSHVTTLDAAGVGSGATLKGTADPNGSETTAWFRYGDTDPGDCDDSFGTRVPEAGGFDLGAGTVPAPFQQALTGLLPKHDLLLLRGRQQRRRRRVRRGPLLHDRRRPAVIETLEAAVTADLEVIFCPHPPAPRRAPRASGAGAAPKSLRALRVAQGAEAAPSPRERGRVPPQAAPTQGSFGPHACDSDGDGD